jgi:Zn-finger nucleic acid-binding protein
MRQLDLERPHAEVDVCDACGGVWIDWFDGEVRAIAAETLRVSDPGPPPPGSLVGAKEAKGTDDAKSSKRKGKGEKGNDDARPSRNEPVAIGACPRCTRQLVAERYVVNAEIESRRVEGKVSVVPSPSPTGAELLRCEDCMGAFVSRTSAEVLSWLSASDDPPESVAAPKLQPVPWTRFVGLIRGFLGMKD